MTFEYILENTEEKKKFGERLIYFYLTILFDFKMKPIWIVRNISFFEVNNAVKNIWRKKNLHTSTMI